MSRRAIYSGSPFEELAGYSRALVDGEWVFVSATSGFDAEIKGFASTAVEQARKALEVIGAALEQAGASFADVVRVQCYLSDAADTVEVCKLLGEIFDDPRPANTTIICGFPDPNIKVEFEMTARRSMA